MCRLWAKCGRYEFFNRQRVDIKIFLQVGNIRLVGLFEVYPSNFSKRDGLYGHRVFLYLLYG